MPNQSALSPHDFTGAPLTGSADDRFDRADARLLIVARALEAVGAEHAPDFVDDPDRQTFFGTLAEDLRVVRAELAAARQLAVDRRAGARLTSVETLR